MSENCNSDFDAVKFTKIIRDGYTTCISQHAMDLGLDSNPDNESVSEISELIEVVVNAAVENIQAKNDVEFIMNFIPEWAKWEIPKGLNPTMYSTGSAQGDQKIKDRVDELIVRHRG